VTATCNVCNRAANVNPYGRLELHPATPGGSLACHGSGAVAVAAPAPEAPWAYVARGRGEGYAVLRAGRLYAVAGREDDAQDLCRRLNAGEGTP
jgi:hypothetical protein